MCEDGSHCSSVTKHRSCPRRPPASVCLVFFISSSLPAGSTRPENTHSIWMKKQGDVTHRHPNMTALPNEAAERRQTATTVQFVRSPVSGGLQSGRSNSSNPFKRLRDGGGLVSATGLPLSSTFNGMQGSLRPAGRPTPKRLLLRTTERWVISQAEAATQWLALPDPAHRPATQARADRVEARQLVAWRTSSQMMRSSDVPRRCSSKQEGLHWPGISYHIVKAGPHDQWSFCGKI